MKLDSKSRAELAQKLTRSLEGPSKNENERLWIQEAMRRSRQFREGQIEAPPASAVLQKPRASILRKRSRSRSKSG